VNIIAEQIKEASICKPAGYSRSTLMSSKVRNCVLISFHASFLGSLPFFFFSPTHTTFLVSDHCVKVFIFLLNSVCSRVDLKVRGHTWRQRV